MQREARTACALVGTAATAPSIEAVETFEGLVGLRRTWNAVWDGARGATPYGAWDWVCAWWQCYARDEKMLNLVIRDGNRRPVAIAPLMRCVRRWRGLQVREVRLASDALETPDPGDMDLVIAEHPPEAALRATFAHLCADPWWDRVWLGRIRADSPNLQSVLSVAAELGLSTEVTHRLPACYIELPPTPGEYLASLGPRARHSLRQWRRRFEVGHGGRARQCLDVAELERVLTHLMQFKIERMRSKGERTQFTSHAYRSLLLQACKSFMERGLLRLTYLEIAGQPVAGQMGFVGNGTWFSHDVFWDPARAHLRLGHLSNLYAIEAAISEGYQVYDMLQGKAHHKSFLARWTRTTLNVCIHRPTRRSALIQCAGQCSAAARQLLRGDHARPGESADTMPRALAGPVRAAPSAMLRACKRIKRLLAPLVNVGVLAAYCRPLQHGPAKLPRTRTPVRLAPADPLHLEQWARICRSRVGQPGCAECSAWISAAALHRRLAEGQEAWCALVGGTPVAMAWCGAGSFGPRRQAARRLRLGPKDAYVYDAFTLPEYRDKGLYTALLTSINRQMRMRGMERALAEAWGSNIASIRAMLHGGYQPHAKTVVVRLLSSIEFGLVRRGSSDDRRKVSGDGDHGV